MKDSSTTNTHLPRQGRCWLFDGANDFGSGLTITATSWTFCCSVKVPSSNTASYRRIFDVGSLRIVAAINDSDTKISLYDGTAWRSGATSLTRGSWVHLAYVFDGTLKLYCNGVEDYAGVGGRTISSETVVLGSQTGNIGINSSIYDARVYNVAKTAGEIAAIYNQSRTGIGTFDTTGLLAAYPCNEESGTTGYDISGNGNHLTLTNITQATFHAADTGVTANRNNAEGYRLSGSVYIPKRLSDSLAADGNALTVSGRAAYHGCAETPCFTGNGSNTSITISSVLASITGDFEFTGWFNTGRTYGALWGNSTNGLYLDTLTRIRLYVAGTHTQFIGVTLVIGQWHYWKVTRVSGTVSMWIDGVALTRTAGPDPNNGTITVSTIGDGFSSFSILGSISDFRFTIDGVTTYFPLQDGPGSSNTNRDIAWVKSDGTGGVISNAIVNGTVSTIWGNRVPGNVEDWCVKYGGRIATNGAFVPGMLTGGNAADGSAKTLTAGKFGNPFSRLNLNPATAAELNGRSVPTAAVVAADINATITPTQSAFRRSKTDGDDRFLIYDDTLSGADLTNVEGYVA